MWTESSFVVWMSILKVSLGGVIEPKFANEDHVTSITVKTLDHLSTHPGENTTPEMAHLDSEDAARMDFMQTETGVDVELKQKVQRNKPVKTAMSNLLITFAEVFSKVAALPITMAIALVNKVSNATNSTLYVGGEITKLPVTITNSIIQELSNITFPN